MQQYSVLMSVYYKEKPEYLRKAMESIWGQTKKTDDFVLVCDGPLNEDLNLVIKEMEGKHPELNVVRLKTNGGLGNALNVGIMQCKNELVARMDSDDISYTDRCEEQLLLFATDPDLEIVSGTVEEFMDRTDNVIGKRELPLTNEEIRIFSRKRNPFNHPSVMFKKSSVISAGGYNERFHLFEDYYLWIRMLMNDSKAANIEKPILYMRTSADLYKRRGGYTYAKNMICFHKWMRSQGWSTIGDYITGAVPHAIICVLPNHIRHMVYKLIHS